VTDPALPRVTAEEYDAAARSACAICHIVEGRPLFPNPRIVYEDDAVIAFLNQFPSQEGYTIVCPKRHVERYETDLTVEGGRTS
jgi:diadenosine tetraphosphate (Ap4A) HIT family hydrolase